MGYEKDSADARTDVEGSGSVADLVSAAAGAGAAGAATSIGQDAATSYQRDYSGSSAKFSDVDKDTGTDERYEVETADRSSAWFQNGKRTYDQYQTLDTDAILYNRKRQAIADADEAQHKASLRSIEIKQAEHTLERSRAEAEQTRRHYEDMHSLRYFGGWGFAADTLQEAFANRVADKVCTQMKG